MNILVTGAQFGNKGAQSLLFTLMNEAQKRFGSDAKIYYMPLDNCFSYKRGEYKFTLVCDTDSHKDFTSLARYKRLFADIKSSSRVSKRDDIVRMRDVLDSIDVLMDVSGYTLASDHARRGVLRYVRRINEAKKHGAKVMLLPQSFGPFDYSEGDKTFEAVKDALRKADLVFAREKDGYDLLKEKVGLSANLHLSPDVVLQSEEPLAENIFTSPQAVKDVELETDNNNVGIIPNMMLLTKVSEREALAAYKEIIDELIALGKNVYIFRHSDDLELCEKIYEMFKENESVRLYREALSCLEYSAFIKKFDFVVAARYHAIVHAYREGTPVIALGWAIKYQELAKAVDQSQYVFDISSVSLGSIDAVKEEIRKMAGSFAASSATIKERVADLQRNNCFDECWKMLE